MASKKGWTAYLPSVISVLLSLLLGGLLVTLRETCMSKQTSDHHFTERYCQGIPDGWVRFIASAIVQAMTLLVAFSLSNAVCAFRTQRLEAGISEGAYVALSGQSPRYQVAALKTNWRYAVALVFLLKYGILVFQPLLNAAETPELVYLSTPSNVTVKPFSQYSDYSYLPTASNTSTVALIALRVRVLLQRYGTGNNAVKKGTNSVTTGVTRYGSLAKRNLTTDPSSVGSWGSGLVFRMQDVVATASSSCDFPQPQGQNAALWDFKTLAQLQAAGNPRINILFGDNFPDSSGNASKAGTFGIAVAVDMSLDPTGTSQTFSGVMKMIQFDTNGFSQNQGGVASLGSDSDFFNLRRCNFTLAFRVADAVTDINTLRIETLSEVAKTSGISSEVLRSTVLSAVSSIALPYLADGPVKKAINSAIVGQLGIGASSYDATFPAGLFERTTYSFMHSLLCSAVSVSLESFAVDKYLQDTTSVVFPKDSDRIYLQSGNSTVGNTTFGAISAKMLQEAGRSPGAKIVGGQSGGDKGQATADKMSLNVVEALYAPAIRSYMPVAAIVSFVVVLVGLNAVLCALAAFFTAKAKINVRPATENALLDNQTVEDIRYRQSRRLAEGSSVHGDPSNDEGAQRKLAFKTMMYCSEHCLLESGGESMVRIGFSQSTTADMKVSEDSKHIL